MEIARGMEAADKNAKPFKITEPSINKLSSPSPKSRGSISCYCCGCTNHGPADCKFIQFINLNATIAGRRDTLLQLGEQ